MASRQEQIVTASNAATVSRWGKIAAMDIKKTIPEDVGDGTCWTQPGRRARNEYLLGRLPPWEEENVPCSVFGRKPERSSNLRSSALKSWLYLRPRSSEPVAEYKESQGPYHQSTSVKRALRELRYSTRTRSDSETRTRIKLDRDGKIDKDFLKAEQEDWANNPFNPANFSQPS